MKRQFSWITTFFFSVSFSYSLTKGSFLFSLTSKLSIFFVSFFTPSVNLDTIHGLIEAFPPKRTHHFRGPIREIKEKFFLPEIVGLTELVNSSTDARQPRQIGQFEDRKDLTHNYLKRQVKDRCRGFF